MSNITLNIKHNNDTLTINTTKTKLLKLDYFNSMFEFGEIPDVIDISLNNFKYDNIDQSLKVLFEFLETEKTIDNVTKEFILSNNTNDGSYWVSFNTSLNISIYNYYILLELCDYFGFESLRNIIKYDAHKYYKFVASCFSHDYKKKINSKYVNHIIKSKTNSIFNIGETLELHMIIVICNELKINIYNLYTLFNNLNYTHFLNQLHCRFIELPKFYENFYTMDKNLTNPISFKFVKRNLLDDIKQYPLNAILDVYEHNNIYHDKNVMLKLYDYYDILTYEPINCEKYHTENYVTPIYHKPSLKLNFDQRFAQETNNIFENFDWSNIIIAGGFIYGLVNNIHDSIIDSTDIDMYVFDSKNGKDANTTRNYILKYFEQYNAIYVVSKHLITIIIPSIKYDIQVIIMDDNIIPQEMVLGFDINFTEIYYDGKDVYASLPCMYALKYQVAVFSKFDKNLDIRICKTILKGLRVKVIPQINNTSELFNDYYDEDGIKIPDLVSVSDKEPVRPIKKGIKGKVGKKSICHDDEPKPKKEKIPPVIQTPEKIYFDSKKIDTLIKAQNFHKQKSVRHAYTNMQPNEFYIVTKELYKCHGVITDANILQNAKLLKSSFSDYISNLGMEDDKKIKGSINNYNYYVEFGDQIIINIF